MIITIDGPAGSGKSTTAQRLAARLNIPCLDTGAMYRAVALRAIRAAAPLDDQNRLTQLARETDLQVACDSRGTRVLLDSEDVTDAIRTMEVNQATGYVARVPGVREVLVDQQRKIGQQLGSLVTEGRDQGSVVFPDADVKFLIDADVETRVSRRCEEMREEGQDVTPDQVRANLIERDDRDQKRWAPLMAPNAATRIDTSGMTINEVVDRMVDQVRRCAASRQQQER